jgi:restriction system protein
MSIPDYQSLMLPLLKLTSDEKEHSLKAATESLAKEFNLSEIELAEMLPSARKTRFYDRVGWAGTYLRKAGLLEAPRRGWFQVTKRGLDVLKKTPEKINVNFLEQFDEFLQFRERREKPVESHEASENGSEQQTPEEAIELAYLRIRQSLADEVLQTVKNCSPSFLNIGY